MATRDAGGPGSPQAEQWDEQRRRQNRAARYIAVLFVVAMLAALGLLVVYVAGGNTQIEGLLLFVGFAAVGAGLGLWVKRIIGPEELVEDRYPLRSDDAARERFAATVEASLGEAGVAGGRRFLLRLLAGAGAALGLALLVPLRSLGPAATGSLFETRWVSGRRLVDVSGRRIRPEDIVSDQVVTVYPEGATDAADSQALLIGMRPHRFDPAALDNETVDNLVCYSKICTHAGCPVGLYRAAAGELLCPCHQSTFDVSRGAIVLSGPAGRPLPQLPMGVDEQGFLIALRDFDLPVGPSFWNLYSRTGAGEGRDG